MRIITSDDFIDTYSKIIQRGNRFFFSKFTFNKLKRTKSAFDNTAFISSNWWMIPKVRKRWNNLITGNENINYKQYLIQKHLHNKTSLKLLSLGSGVCSNELELAEYKNIFKEIVCVDIADNFLTLAAKNAKEKGLQNIRFVCKNIYDFEFKKNEYDIVFFHASLHHFNHIEELLTNKIKQTLKPNGNLIINEFVGATRHQFSKNQITEINNALRLIPKEYRKRFKIKLYKNGFRGPGILRMILADPSECIDSKSIIPAIHKHFKIVDEKPFGGNILMNVLRDISHHFVESDAEKDLILETLFSFEDTYLKNNSSDFVFGIYENRE